MSSPWQPASAATAGQGAVATARGQGRGTGVSMRDEADWPALGSSGAEVDGRGRRGGRGTWSSYDSCDHERHDHDQIAHACRAGHRRGGARATVTGQHQVRGQLPSTLTGGQAVSRGDAWECRTCTFRHTGRRRTFLTCAVCGMERGAGTGEDLGTVTGDGRNTDDKSCTGLAEADSSVHVHEASVGQRSTHSDTRPASHTSDGNDNGGDTGTTDTTDADGGLALVLECCGGLLPADALRRLYVASGNSVDCTIELALGCGWDSESLASSDEALALLLQEDEDAQAAEAMTLDEAAATDTARRDGTGGHGMRPHSDATAAHAHLWGGRVVRRRRGGTPVDWRALNIPVRGHGGANAHGGPSAGAGTAVTGTGAAPSAEEVEATFCTELGLHEDTPPADEARWEQRRLKNALIAAARRASAAYARGARLEATAHSVTAGGMSSAVDRATDVAVAAVLREHNTPSMVPREIDLHGLHVAEAVGVLERYIFVHDEFVQKYGRRYHIREFVCITGRGRNSRDGCPRLKPALSSWLSANGVRFRDRDPGSLVVSLK